MSKRLVFVGSMLAVSTLNLAATLPVLAQADLQNRVVKTERFERPSDAIVNNSDLEIAPPKETQVDASQVKVIQRTPRRFQAFELKDPETGKPISADTILKLPDGKTVKAGEYYAELNRLEQQFSQLGYSLREPEEEVQLQESTVDQSVLQKQEDAIKKEHEPVDSSKTTIQEFLEPNKVLDLINKGTDPASEFAPDQNTQEKQVKTDAQSTPSDAQSAPSDAQSGPPVDEAAAANKIFLRTWNQSIGNPSTFSAYLNGKLELKGSTTFSNAYAEANAGGYIFNQQANLLRATANLNAPASGSLTTNLNLLVLGQNVYNLNRQGNGVLSLGDTHSRSVDRVIADIRFSLGPIPMRAKFGVQGSAGFKYSVYASPKFAYAQVNPFLDSKAYGQGGADIVVGGAGAGANLTLLKDNLNIDGLAGVTVESGTNKPYLYTYYSGYNQIEALSGNVYAYAFIYVPKFGIPPWKKKQWTWNIWNWTGLKHSGYLFSGSGKTYL